MSDITAERIMIQQEETAFNASVSEATASRLGAAINFINLYQANIWQFNLNGPYNAIQVPNLQVDGIVSFPFPWEIVYLYIYSGHQVGLSGNTTLDLKWAAFNSSSYVTIFDGILPHFDNGAAADDTCGLGQVKAGFNSFSLAKSQFDAYDKIRFDLITAMTGTVEGAGLGLVYRPRAT